MQAFERLYRLHVDRIHGLCWRLCDGDPRRAEQATRDCFVRAWEKLAEFRGEAQFGTWLHRIAVGTSKAPLHRARKLMKELLQ